MSDRIVGEVEKVSERNIVRLEDAPTRKALGGTLKSIFGPDNVGAKNFRFSISYFDPNEGLQVHIHPESEEVYYVISGEGIVYLGLEKKEIPIQPGMSLYVDAGTPHGVTNTGKEKLLIAFFVAPGKDKTVVP
jgi:mannose-6-phosphate isomerase-like protein (cupin superfamily)